MIDFGKVLVQIFPIKTTEDAGSDALKLIYKIFNVQ